MEFNSDSTDEKLRLLHFRKRGICWTCGSLVVQVVDLRSWKECPDHKWSRLSTVFFFFFFFFWGSNLAPKRSKQSNSTFNTKRSSSLTACVCLTTWYIPSMSYSYSWIQKMIEISHQISGFKQTHIRFPKMGVPPNHPFLDGIFPYKPSILGVPPFMETTKEPCNIPFSCSTRIQVRAHGRWSHAEEADWGATAWQVLNHHLFAPNIFEGQQVIKS